MFAFIARTIFWLVRLVFVVFLYQILIETLVPLVTVAINLLVELAKFMVAAVRWSVGYIKARVAALTIKNAAGQRVNAEQAAV